MRVSFSLISCAVALSLGACTDKDETIDSTGTGTTGTTSGGTSGSTTSGGPSHLFTSFSGEVSVQTVIDGATSCDTVTQLEGTAYTGDCDDCTFAFEIAPTVTADNSAADCSHPYYWSYTGGWEGYTDQFLAFWETADYYGYDYNNVLAWGYGIDYTGSYYSYYYPGPYFSWLTYEGSYYVSDGSATFDGSTLSWNLASSGYDYFENYSDDSCGSESVADGGGNLGGDWVGEGNLPGDGTSGYDWYYVVDVWDITTVPGEGVSVTVDTVSDGTAFDPWMWVNDGESCTIGEADDSFDCTFPPPKYSCPSVSFTAAGTAYEVVVASYGSCAGALGEYALSIDTSTDPKLTLNGDNVDRKISLPYEVHVSGSAAVGK